ncbi:MAG: tyrosine-type recombinase/integrase [Dehalococcoidia bacterium]
MSNPRPSALNRRADNDSHPIQSIGALDTGTNGNDIANPGEPPEFLEADEIEALIRFAPNPVARLCMCIQWRAGLTIAEALLLTQSDVDLEADSPVLEVRQTGSGKNRIVPVHRHLGLSFMNAFKTWKRSASDPLMDTNPQQLWDWYMDALNRCHEQGTIPEGKLCSANTLRHSAARNWLLSGVPINVVSKWLGHFELQTTMVYLDLVSDSGGFMERVP